MFRISGEQFQLSEPSIISHSKLFWCEYTRNIIQHIGGIYRNTYNVMILAIYSNYFYDMNKL